MRELITIICTVCKNKNYHSTKNKKKHTEKLELSKFCRSCRKHTPHKETK
ncbi:MAG: 50S ribosomal protein L33 [Candidatus Omnitrophota bacterium]